MWSRYGELFTDVKPANVSCVIIEKVLFTKYLAKTPTTVTFISYSNQCTTVRIYGASLIQTSGGGKSNYRVNQTLCSWLVDLTTTSECLLAVCSDLSLWKHRDNKNKNISTKKYEQLPCRSEFVWTVYKFNSTGFLFKTRINRHHFWLLALHHHFPAAADWRPVTQRILIFVKLQLSFSDCSKMHPKWLSLGGLTIFSSCILAMRDTVTVWKHKPSPDWELRVIYDARRVTKRHLRCHISQCISHPLPFNFVLNRPDRGAASLC